MMPQTRAEVVTEFLQDRLAEEQEQSRAGQALLLLIEHVNSMANFDDEQPLFVVAAAWQDHPDWPGDY